MSDNNVYIPGKRVLRSQSLLSGSTNLIYSAKVPAKRAKQPTSNKCEPKKPANSRKEQNKENSCCSLTETVNALVLQISKQNDELVSSRKQLVEMQTKYINLWENHFVRNEKAVECKKKMEDEISFLKSELEKAHPQQVVQDLICFDDNIDNIGNTSCVIYYSLFLFVY